MDHSLPAFPYYYQNRSQNSSWVKHEGKGPYPRIVVRLWNTHIKINRKNVLVATIDREKKWYRLFSRFRIPLPVCDPALPEAREVFSSIWGSVDSHIKTLRLGKAQIGKNIFDQRYYWDGKVLIIGR